MATRSTLIHLFCEEASKWKEKELYRNTPGDLFLFNTYPQVSDWLSFTPEHHLFRWRAFSEWRERFLAMRTAAFKVNVTISCQSWKVEDRTGLLTWRALTALILETGHKENALEDSSSDTSTTSAAILPKRSYFERSNFFLIERNPRDHSLWNSLAT